MNHISICAKEMSRSEIGILDLGNGCHHKLAQQHQILAKIEHDMLIR